MRIDLLIYTEGGTTIDIAKELLKREDVTSVSRTIGEHSIDLRVEAFVKDNGVLLDLLEQVRAMKGVRDVVWVEVIETMGRKSSLNQRLLAPQLSVQTIEALSQPLIYQY